MKFLSRSVTLALTIFAIVPSLQSQVVDKKALTLDGAKKVIAAAAAEAKKNHAAGVIAVVDDGGNLMALERLDNTFPAGANISIGKAKTAALFKRPTRFFEEIINKGRTAMAALPPAPDFTPLIGGIPIILDEQVIGAVGVSGASSAHEDEELAIAGAKALTAASAAPKEVVCQPVSYFEKERVAAAFEKGAVLFDQSDKYMVHASRREQAGVPEVHAKDADIIYVLDGAATFVTGGTVLEPKTTAPDEVRGKEIQGGEARRIAKGDVIIVPAGTPHWFKEVEGPMTYYVVKAR